MTRVSLRSQEQGRPATASVARVRQPVVPDYAAIAADAARLAALPRHTLLRVLHLVAQLPALGPADLYELVYPGRTFDGDLDLVAMLEQRGLVRAYFERKHIRDATHAVLNKAGIRILATGLGVGPEALTLRYGLDDASLADRVGSPWETLPRYGMLVDVAAAHQEYTGPRNEYRVTVPAQLLGWRRHWPPDAPDEPTPEPLRSALPALATLRWEGARTLSYLLLADTTDEDEPLAHNVRPVEFYRPIVEHLLAVHARRRAPVPRLFVALGDGPLRANGDRRQRWRTLLADARARCPEAAAFRFEVGDAWSVGGSTVSRDLRGEPDPPPGEDDR
jgi:hypothetical protein